MRLIKGVIPTRDNDGVTPKVSHRTAIGNVTHITSQRLPISTFYSSTSSLQRCQLLFEQLPLVDTRVLTLQFEKLLVRATLHDPSVVHHEDLVGVLHR